MPKLLWLDLETTGLDPVGDQILEVAAVIAPTLDRPFELSTESYQAVLKWLSPPKMDEVVWRMHTKNGLLREAVSSAITVDQAEEELLKLVPMVEDKEERTILAGSTIGFDKSFIKHWMPRLNARLSYRLYDVTAIKLFARSMGMEKLPKAEAHRAMDDLNESVAHGQAVADWFKHPDRLWRT